MTNSEKYRFNDFTLDHYKEIIVEIKKNHDVISFEEADLNSKSACILRHDIDFSVQNSVKMAELENASGVRSTFFVHIHSEFYNALEKTSVEGINEIIRLGHDIGIHFDVHHHNISTKNELVEKLSFEKSVFSNYFDKKVNSFSFHNTNKWILDQKDDEYAGLKNVYSSFFLNNFSYCSDSNGYWHFDRIIDHVRKNKGNNLQLLTHPLWWGTDVESPRDKIRNYLENYKNEAYENYSMTLANGGRLNIDWNEV